MTDQPARFESFDEFWPFYVGEHTRQACRILHYCAAVAALAIVGAAIWTSNWWLLLLAPVASYGLAWVGHFVFERNRPATWSYVRWSLLAEFKMFGLFLRGRMGREVEKYARR